MAGIENPVIYTPDQLFATSDIMDMFKVSALDQQVFESVSTCTNGTPEDTGDTDLDKTLSDFLPSTDIQQFMDLTKVEVESPNSTHHIWDGEQTAFNYSSDLSDKQLTSRIISSIRKRFMGSNPVFAQKNSNAQPVMCDESRVKVQKIDHSCHNILHQLEMNLGQDRNPDCQSEVFQYSPNMNSSPDSSISMVHGRSPIDSASGSPDDIAGIMHFTSMNGFGNEFVSSSVGQDTEANVVLAGTRPRSPVKSRHLLPPCRVCGDQASGFHYGANTCEACKVRKKKLLAQPNI